MIITRCPTRIDLAGGWTDIPTFLEHTVGFVVNIAINLYSRVYVSTSNVDQDSDATLTCDRSMVHLYSTDFDEEENVEDIQQIELTGSFALAKAALKR